MKQKLSQILNDLINNNWVPDGPLSGGLCLLFRAPDGDSDDYRLCAYRVGVEVGTVELGTLRRELEAMLPGKTISLDAEKTITGRDEKIRHYRVFRWAGTPAATQLALLPVGAPGARQYTED